MKKKTGLIVLVAVVVVIIIAVIALTGGSESKEVKKILCSDDWYFNVKANNGKAATLYIFFEDNGKYRASLYIGSERQPDESGTYRISDGVIYCTPTGKGYQYDLRFKYEYDKKTETFSLYFQGKKGSTF